MEDKTALAGTYVIIKDSWGKDQTVKILDKVLKGGKGVHSTGMFHWKQTSAYGYSYEVYLVEYEESYVKDYENRENGYADIDRPIYDTRKKVKEIYPSDIIELAPLTDKKKKEEEK